MRWLSFACVLLVASLAGCAVPERGPAVPVDRAQQAEPLGVANVRFFADGDLEPMIREGKQAQAREEAALRALGRPTTPLPPAHFLAISGGGANGAFGAGLLNGWTASGQRPTFSVVTGISTGALIAPFAFLGPSYDPTLRELYTSLTPERIFRRRSLAAIFFGDALVDATPLAEMIDKYADQALLDAIGREYEQGRLLLIGTTDLDAQRPVIWNIGALAVSRHPRALDLFRKILRASTAIPGAFQPVLIDVEIDGVKFQEMHVDGGAMVQLFLYPPSLEVGRIGEERTRSAYIIRNARVDPDHAETEPRTISIAARAIATMLAASGNNDLLRTYFVTRRDGVDYNLAFIGADFVISRLSEFDQAYMQALYDYGYQRAAAGVVWHKAPPALAPQRRRTQL
ncbi:MAG: patatin-like phospholipase family protein [Alphaproteobacteria bacterium]|nr:patatin-like phospholipase family protein [Alphaproteobacteria bacterium]MBV8407439.1 patatin-like phospholipase family protein [Alphaproteobacteria bacterium]